MNAHTPDPAAPQRVLTVTIIQNLDVLRRLADPMPLPGRNAMAADFGSDPANFGKMVRRLEEDGAVYRADPDEFTTTRLTPFGEQVLRGIAVIDGKAVLPAGVAWVEARRLRPNPDNPRTDWDTEAARAEDAAFKESIFAGGGPNLPLEVFPEDAEGHMIQTGERRWRAVLALIAEGRFPPDKTMLVLIKARSAEEADAAMGRENIQRRQLGFGDEARWYQRMMALHGWSHQKCAEEGKRSVKTVQDYLRLLQHPDILERLETDPGYTLHHARPDIAQRNNPALFGKDEAPKARAPEAAAPPLEATPDEAAYMALATSPRMALIVAELRHKIETDPAEDPDWTTVLQQPTDSLCEMLIRHQVLMFQRKAGVTVGRVILKTDGARKWLEDNGFFEGSLARAALLNQLRHEVDSFQAAKALQNGRYMTAWLNLEPEPAPLIREGLIGDDFSRQLREARETPDADPSEDPRPARPAAQPQELQRERPSSPSEPGSKPASPNTAGLDAKIVSAVARDISDRLQQWRAERGRPHWSALDDDGLIEELGFAINLGRPLDVITLLAIGREHAGAAKTGNLLRDAVASISALEG